MNTFDEIKGKINIPIASFEQIHQGINSKIFLINNNIKIKVSDCLETEYNILQELQRMETIKIPKIYDYFQLDNKKYCLITEFIQGVAMSSAEHYNSSLIFQISEYLKELHLYHPKNIQFHSTQLNIKCYLEKLNLYQHILSYETLTKLYKAYEKHYFHDVKFLTHGDLHGYNIICDNEYKKIITIIDYGSSCFDDEISDLKLFGNKTSELAKYMGYKEDEKMIIGYFFHVVLRKLLELDYNINNDTLITDIKNISNMLNHLIY